MNETRAMVELCHINRYIKLVFSVSIMLPNEKRNELEWMYSKFTSARNVNWYYYRPFSLLLMEFYSPTGKKECIHKAYFSERSKWLFCRRLETVIDKIKTDQDLFYLYEGRLVLNEDLAKKYEDYVQVGKTMFHIRPCVVPVISPSETQETEELYEGVLIEFPGSTGCKLTFEEAEFLIDYMRGINYHELTFEVLNHVTLDLATGYIRVTLDKNQKELMQTSVKHNKMQMNGVKAIYETVKKEDNESEEENHGEKDRI